MLKLPEDGRSIYLRIVDGVRAAIEARQIVTGERLPATRELARRLGVHRHTVMTALEELVAEGWLTSRERSGYFVNGSPPSRFGARGRGRTAKVDGRDGAQPHFPWESQLGLSRIPGAREDDRVPEWGVSFQNSGPDLRLLPFSEICRCLRLAMQEDPVAVLGYGEARGYGPFVDAVKSYVRRTCGIREREIIVTNGSTEACLLVSHLLLGHGKSVAMEALCYPPIYHQFRLSGADVAPVPSDKNGMDPDALEDIVGKRKIDLIYLNPLHHYPTVVTLPAERRKRIYEIAVRNKISILEDEHDHEFHYRAQPLAPLASDDPAGLVIYVSSFSRSVFPAARIGYLAVPGELSTPLQRVRRSTTFQSGSLLQAALVHWIEDGGFERHLKRMRRIYEGRMLRLVSRLAGLKRTIPRLEFRRPDGGLALWLDTGRDADLVARNGLRRGVAIVPESAFDVTSRCGGRHVRLGYACLDEVEIDRGIDLLADTLRATPVS